MSRCAIDRGLAACALLISMMLPAGVLALEPEANQRLILDPGFHTNTIWQVAASADGSRILSASSDSTARLFDAEGHLLRVFRVPRSAKDDSRLYACALSANGKLAAVAGETGFGDFARAIYIFDTDSGGLRSILADLAGPILGLAFSPDGAHLASTMGYSGLHVFDIGSGRELFSDYSHAGYAVVWSPDGRYFATACNGRKIRLYEAGKEFRRMAETEARNDQNVGLAFGLEGTRLLLAVGYNVDGTSPDVYEAGPAGLSWLHSPDRTGTGAGRLGTIAFMRDGKSGTLRLVAGGNIFRDGHAPIVVWDDAGRGMRRIVSIGATNTITSMCGTVDADGSEPRLLVASAGPYLALLGGDFETHFEKVSPLADFRGLVPDDRGDGRFRLSREGSSFLFTYGVSDDESQGFSLKDRALGALSELPAPETGSLPLRDWFRSEACSLYGTPLIDDEGDRSLSLAIAPNGRRFLLGTDWYLHCFSYDGTLIWKNEAPAAVMAVAVSGDGRLGAACFSDGIIRFYRMSNGALVLSFFPHVDRIRWAAWTPSGYYASSSGADEFLRWHLDNGPGAAPDSYPVSRLKSIFYRPDVVQAIMETLDEGKALEMANARMGRSEAPLTRTDVRARMPPVLTLLPPAGGSKVSAPLLEVEYRIRTVDGMGVEGLRLMVDGRPVTEGVRGLEARCGDGIYDLSLPVPPRDCVVSLVAMNKDGVWSDEERLFLKWSGLRTSPRAPRLNLLAVGIADYAEDRFDLTFAAKDALDFALLMQTREGRAFRDVTTRHLVNDKATKAAIADGLEWLSRSTEPDDVAMLFFAGHGACAPKGGYWLLPYDYRSGDLEGSGYNAEELMRAVQGITGKVAVIVDACYSGSAMGVWAAPDIDGTTNDLSAPWIGAIVFGSSTGEEASLEYYEWDNGLFTRGLLDALGQGAMGSGIRGELTLRGIHRSAAERMADLLSKLDTVALADRKARGARETALTRFAGTPGVSPLRQTPVLVIPESVGDIVLGR